MGGVKTVRGQSQMLRQVGLLDLITTPNSEYYLTVYNQKF